MEKRLSVNTRLSDARIFDEVGGIFVFFPVWRVLMVFFKDSSSSEESSGAKDVPDDKKGIGKVKSVKKTVKSCPYRR